ncbi:hypothetical protein DP116_09650 [Brasilonema bromeliae SPC951]|uniref:Uncharacterized protein n=2 Tax=Bromeliae group (in: Brasilonema) TaxID=3398495 RepID=A0ABX1P5Q9_9CYAN|nr:hypothetical protein [Brasilonema bromeliae SPC951]
MTKVFLGKIVKIKTSAVFDVNGLVTKDLDLTVNQSLMRVSLRRELVNPIAFWRGVSHRVGILFQGKCLSYSKLNPFTKDQNPQRKYEDQFLSEIEMYQDFREKITTAYAGNKKFLGHIPHLVLSQSVISQFWEYLSFF